MHCLAGKSPILLRSFSAVRLFCLLCCVRPSPSPAARLLAAAADAQAAPLCRGLRGFKQSFQSTIALLGAFQDGRKVCLGPCSACGHCSGL